MAESSNEQTIPKLPIPPDVLLPPKYKCPMFDAALVCNERDYPLSIKVIQIIRKFVSIQSRPPDICTLDNEGPLSWLTTPSGRLDEAIKRSTYILLLMTKNLPKDSNETKVFRDEIQFERIYGENRYDTVVTLHTYTKNGADKHKFYPVGIRSIIGVDIRKLYSYAESSECVSDAMLDDVGEVAIEGLQNLFDERLGMRIEREERLSIELVAWKEEYARQRHRQNIIRENDRQREEHLLAEIGSLQITGQSHPSSSSSGSVNITVNISNPVMLPQVDNSDGQNDENISYHVVERDEHENSHDQNSTESETHSPIQVSDESSLGLPNFIRGTPQAAPLSYLGQGGESFNAARTIDNATGDNQEASTHDQVGVGTDSRNDITMASTTTDTTEEDYNFVSEHL